MYIHIIVSHTNKQINECMYGICHKDIGLVFSSLILRNDKAKK